MKRRSFVRSLLIAPVAPAALVAQDAAPQKAATPQPSPPPRPAGRGFQNVKYLDLTGVDLTAETFPGFFTADQFAALQKLGAVLMPPLKGNPGAAEARAPEFLDFLLGISDADRQKLYRDGLDGLNASALDRFHQPFAKLDAEQADAIIKPLLVARPWSKEYPADAMKRFIAAAHDDFRTATMNSREWAAASAAAAETTGGRRRGFNRSIGFYWRPIDPIVRD